MASGMVAAVGSFDSESHEATLLIAGPQHPVVEALSSRLAQRFDALSVSALSEFAVTVEAVGVPRIDVAIVDCPGPDAAETIGAYDLPAETTVVALVPPDERPSLPPEVAVVERRGDWLDRLESWLRPRLNGGPPGGSVDAREQYERLLERQNHRLKEFTGIISHDLRNPLQVISGRAELARETGEEEHLDAIVETAARMETFLDDLLELARQGTIVGDPAPVDLEAVAREAWAQTDTAEATLLFEGPERIVADRGRLRSLLGNLFSNAVDHAGPDVTVTVGSLSDGFFVADDGPGIPDEERDDIFVHGYTTSDEGTGFGLSIVESIAGAHGWEVRLVEMDYPARPDGACFEFTGVERPSDSS